MVRGELDDGEVAEITGAGSDLERLRRSLSATVMTVDEHVGPPLTDQVAHEVGDGRLLELHVVAVEVDAPGALPRVPSTLASEPSGLISGATTTVTSSSSSYASVPGVAKSP